MNIIIAGATGYLGQKLLERLINRNHKIMIIMRSTNAYLNELIEKKKIDGCGVAVDELEYKIRSFEPDVVFCTTCCYETDPNFLDKTIDANYGFPSLLLRIVSHLEIGKNIRFISIGTSLPPTLNLYSLTKYQFGEIGRFFGMTGKIQFVNILLESFYGIDEPPVRFISRSIIKLKNNSELLLTEGKQKRDFIFIDDVTKILEYLCYSPVDFQAYDNYLSLPVGSGCQPSIMEILYYLKELCNSNSDLKFGTISLRKNEPSTVADLSLLRELGYRDEIVFWKDGMKKIVEGM